MTTAVAQNFAETKRALCDTCIHSSSLISNTPTCSAVIRESLGDRMDSETGVKRTLYTFHPEHEGRVGTTLQPHPFCRDILKDGMCKLYVARPANDDAPVTPEAPKAPRDYRTLDNVLQS